MADFIDSEASESDNDDELNFHERKRLAKIKKNFKDSSEEEDDDDEAIREEMKDLIDDGPVEEEDDESSSSSSYSDDDGDGGHSDVTDSHVTRGAGEGHHSSLAASKHKRARHDDLDDGLEDDDYDLIEENLGVKVSRLKHLKRIRRISDDSDEDESKSTAKYNVGNLDRVDQISHSGEESLEDEEDVDDFLVDADNNPISRGPKKKKKVFADAALQEAQDIFGVDFDYEEFEKYDEVLDSEMESEQEDISENETGGDEALRRRLKRERRKNRRRNICDLYEPADLERGHLTDRDALIRQTDAPERYQSRDIPVTAVADDVELQDEAVWILKNAFLKKPITSQTRDEEDECRERLRMSTTVLLKVKSVLDFIRNKGLEIPFIAFYKKECILPDLGVNELWKIYLWDEKWCELQSRKRSLKRLLQKIQKFQGDLIMKDPKASLPDNMRVLQPEDIERVLNAETLEELSDIHVHFRLYYSHDVVQIHTHEVALAQKLKSKRKRTVRRTRINEEGEEEEVEVETDGEGNDGEVGEGTGGSTDLEVVKYACPSSPYEMCKRHGLETFCRRIGLSPLQFGENLRDTYQKHDVAQCPLSPEELAQEYINQTLKTSADVFKAVTYMVAVQLSCEPLVRKCTRELFYTSARICVRPTKRGAKEIDEAHIMYSMKYLKDKPITSLRDDQFLHILIAEREKLIELKIGDVITNYAGLNFVDEAKNLYCRDEFSRNVQQWNEIRANCIELAFSRFLYPVLRKELRNVLRQESHSYLIRQIRRRLFNWLAIAPYTCKLFETDKRISGRSSTGDYESEEESDQGPDDEDDENEDEEEAQSASRKLARSSYSWSLQKGGLRVLALAYDLDKDSSSYACVVHSNAAVVDFIKQQHTLRRLAACHRLADRERKQAELRALTRFITKNCPHVMVVCGESRDAINVCADLSGIVSKLVSQINFPSISVEIVDNGLAKVFANSLRAEQEFRDYPLVLRQAVSLARRIHDPLIEFTQLCNADDEIMCLHYHPLQSELAKDDLSRTITIEFVNRVNEIGVDINRSLANQHFSPMLQFVCGLGPRKSAHILRCLQHNSQRLANRTELVTVCHLGPRVLTNSSGFIRIQGVGDLTDRFTDMLDSTRIHLETYEWARKMAVDALEYEEDSDEVDPSAAVEEIMQCPERLKDLDLDAFAEELERQNLGNRSITLYDIRSELSAPYKDLRLPYMSADALELFNMLTGETPNTLYRGKLLTCTVTGFTRRRPTAEQLSQDNPVRDTTSGLWQCPFCLKKDFLELSEVWSHFDMNACPGKAIGVRVRLDNGCFGFIQMKNLSNSRVTNPEERVRPGQIIFCRAVKIDIEKFWIELTSRSSDLADENNDWRPFKDNYYDFEAMKCDQKVDAQKKQKASQSYLKRVIVHPAFRNVNFKEATSILAKMNQGEAIVRPSSQGSQFLTVSWNVAKGIIQHIKVEEYEKDNAFSIGKRLVIDGDKFEDLDEILARHVGQLASYARDIFNFRYYRDTNGGDRKIAEEILREEKAKNAYKIPYIMSVSKEYAGKFMLSCLPGSRVRHEYVTLTVDGLRYRQQIFDSLPALLHWFKDHFHESVSHHVSRAPGSDMVLASDRQSQYNTPHELPGRSVHQPGYLDSGLVHAVTHGLTGLNHPTARNTPSTPAGVQGYASAINTPYTPSMITPYMLTPSRMH